MNLIGRDNFLNFNGQLPPGLPPMLFARDFGFTFPDLGKYDRLEIANQLTRDNPSVWRRLPSSDACVDIYSGHSESTDTLIEVWGPRSGVIFAGSADVSTRRAFNEIVSGFILENGFCKWP